MSVPKPDTDNSFTPIYFVFVKMVLEAFGIHHVLGRLVSHLSVEQRLQFSFVHSDGVEELLFGSGFLATIDWAMHCIAYKPIYRKVKKADKSKDTEYAGNDGGSDFRKLFKAFDKTRIMDDGEEVQSWVELSFRDSYKEHHRDFDFFGGDDTVEDSGSDDETEIMKKRQQAAKCRSKQRPGASGGDVRGGGTARGGAAAGAAEIDVKSEESESSDS